MNQIGPMTDAQGTPVLFGGCPVLFAFIVAPDGTIGFAHGAGVPPLALLGALQQWLESFRFTAYQKQLGLEPRVIPARPGLVT